MSLVHKWVRLSSEERRFAFQAWMTALLVRAGLWFLPFAIFRRLAEKAAQETHATDSRFSIPLAHLCRLITAVSRRIPNATCLVTAFTAFILLRRQGYPANVRLGVTRDDRALLKAHAWVELNDQILVGRQEGECYVPLRAPQDIMRTANHHIIAEGGQWMRHG